MTAWSRGYVADSPYTAAYHPAQVPAHLALTAAINGVAWRPREQMTVVDIGCGRGTVIGTLAASNPGWNCIGIDYNPAHVAELSELADAARLENLGALEADVAALSEAEIDQLPPIDVAMLHGVWTWVSDAVRDGIVRLLQRRLKPGGLVYISYNALPGFGADAALQRVMRLGASMEAKGNSTERAQAGIPLARALRDAGAAHLAHTPMLERMLSTDAPLNAAYLAHEMLTAHWRPVFFADLLEALGPARLDYVGSATLHENLPDMVLEPAQRAIWDAMPDATARELVKDICLQRPFRRDVFIRGARRVDREAALDSILMAQVSNRPNGIPYLPTERGKAELPERISGPVLAALAEGPQTIGELRSRPPGARLTPEELLVMLEGTFTAMPIWRPTPDAHALRRARHFNVVMAEMHAPGGLGHDRLALASPLIGAGLPCSPLELALATQPDIAEVDAAVLTARLQPGMDAAAQDEAVAVAKEAIRERLPFWNRFGIT
jgi:SAM-dependent methyltransferase